MDLYEIKFAHYSQKDNKEGIITYAIASNDENVYEWLKSEPELENDWICTCWQYNEDDEVKYYGVPFKEYIISVCGEMYSEYANLDDLYYGKTYYGWQKIKEDIQDNQIIALCETIGLVDIENYIPKGEI